MLKTVQVKVLRNVAPPAYQTEQSAGFDLASSGWEAFEPQQFRLVPTGIALATPAGHFLMLTPRSSLFKRHGLMLVNSPGIVDADYCGDDDEIMLALFNPTLRACTLQPGERVAQGVFVPYLEALWQEVDKLEGDSRGGFGSTGQ